MCNPSKIVRHGNKADKIDAKILAELLRTGALTAVCHGEKSARAVKELALSYISVVADGTRIKNRLKAMFRARGNECNGAGVYDPDERKEWMAKLDSKAVRYDKIEFLNDPSPLPDRHLGTEMVEYDGKLLETTGAERTLVECLLRPGRVGGIEEFINSVGGLPAPKLDLIEEILKLYSTKHLYAAVGWYLERCQEAWNVPADFLERLEKHRPSSPQYLERRSGFGKLFPRWNLILPRFVVRMGGLDEP